MHSFAVDGSIEEGLAKKRTAVDSMGRGKVACNNVCIVKAKHVLNPLILPYRM